MNTMTATGIRYGVEFPKSRPGQRTDILLWCRETFGEPGFRKRWMPLDYTIQFRDKKDRDWYMLRWGS